MTAENFDTALRTLLNRKPFQVFIAPGGVPVIFDHDSVNLFIGDTSNSLPPGGGA